VAIKFVAVVVACGIYQGHNRVCIEWTDQYVYPTRAQCLVRAQAISKDVRTLTGYAHVVLERSPKLTCKVQTKILPQQEIAPPVPVKPTPWWSEFWDWLRSLARP
jgi:hypothetical protein